MYTERDSFGEIDILPASEQFWVLLTDVTCADVNEVLEIYKQVTGKPAIPIGEKDFERLKDEFQNGGKGVVEWEIKRGRNLEWRRAINPDGVYVRFKFGGGDMHNAYRVNGIEKTIRTRVDDYFKGRSKPLSEIT